MTVERTVKQLRKTIRTLIEQYNWTFTRIQDEIRVLAEEYSEG